MSSPVRHFDFIQLCFHHSYSLWSRSPSCSPFSNSPYLGMFCHIYLLCYIQFFICHHENTRTRKCKKSNNTGLHVEPCVIYLFLYVLFFTAFFLTHFGGLGITAGAHRLWAHRTYKAKLPLRILLMLAQTFALQNDIHEWVRDHRVHHKFTDTDADPHNSTRGFFFSHMGWLMVKKHKDVFIKGKTVDMSDVASDPVVRFQRK
jgi:fatty-acid desaturase